MNTTHNADGLTLDTFNADMATASALLTQASSRFAPITVDVALVNPTANFTSRATRSRIWVSTAVKLCRLHGVQLPAMRRESKDERQQFAVALCERVRMAVSSATVDAIDISVERAPHASKSDATAHYALLLAAMMNVSSAERFISRSLNTRLTPAKRYGKTHFMKTSPMFQHFAVAVSILALCLASVSCVAHAVAF